MENITKHKRQSGDITVQQMGEHEYFCRIEDNDGGHMELSVCTDSPEKAADMANDIYYEILNESKDDDND